ncbi:MAG: OmpA family protein [Cytophagales bacterium]|nr:OmpA family protein [Cytophagales bacterium]
MRIFLIINVTFFLFINTGKAQKAQPDEQLVTLGKEMYGFGDKKDALELFIQALEINPDNVQASYMAGICYLETIQKYLSVKYFIRAYELNPNISDDILYKIAQGYHYGSNFDDAIRYYSQYKNVITALPNDKRYAEMLKTERKIYECNNGILYYQNPTHHEIKRLPGSINSEYPEYAPAINASQSEIIFTSRRAGGTSPNKDIDNEYFEDIYIASHQNNEWSKVKNIGKIINSSTHDASIGYSADGKTLFLYKPTNGGDIFYSTRIGDTSWTEPINMGLPVNSRYCEPSVSINNTGTKLYFASDRPGGFGGLDIYISALDAEGKWEKPQNLGTVINTNFDDDSPFISFDNKTLYFSSRGHKGMGEYDIYKSDFDTISQQWKAPENMGYPINSPDNDIYFVIASDNKSAYFASAREGGKGGNDLYFINLHYAKKIMNDTTKPKTPVAKNMKIKNQKTLKPTTAAATNNTMINSTILQSTLKLKVIDEKEALPLDAKISVVKLASGKKETKIYSADKEGNIQIKLEHGYDYAIEIQKDGFLFYSENIDIPTGNEVKQINKTITLQKITKGNKIVLKNVFFEHGKFNLAEDSKSELDLLLDLLIKNKNIRIEVSGHTDDTGTDEINNRLSYERARSVAEYLIKKGVDKNRLMYRGYGKNRPIASNTTDDGKKLNRRTEFEVLK